MDLPWGDAKTVKFVTNVGMITSHGVRGDNVMAAEWTHQVSYSPGLIAVSIGHGKATEENIIKSKEFGVNLAAFDQNVIASVAGGSSGKNVDKIAVLRELGAEFYNASKIKALMIRGAVLNLECKLIREESMGDHTVFVGEVLHAEAGEKEPLVYHGLKYWSFGKPIEKPNEAMLAKIKTIVEKHKR